MYILPIVYIYFVYHSLIAEMAGALENALRDLPKIRDEERETMVNHMYSK